MAYINEQNYLERKTGFKQGGKPSTRNWWFARFGNLSINRITIPRRLWGKRLQFKVEVKPDV